jgi:PAS domain S-box-containing protein
MDIVKINLDNELDLILAHKRSMKLAELCGLSVLTQTSFATAVSEISRCVIGEKNSSSTLLLGVEVLKNNRKELSATISTNRDLEKLFPEAIKYARRLAANLDISRSGEMFVLMVTQGIERGGLINDNKLKSFVTYFRSELPLSPYDEIRKKNILLLEMHEKLQNSENQYRILTETLPLMMFSTNVAGQITYGNKWLKDFFKLAEIRPGKISWLSLITHEKSKTLSLAWEKAAASGTQLKSQAKLKTPEGENIWHLISMIPVRNEQNSVAGWTGFFVDIQAQKVVEETLKNNEELKATQKLLLSSQAKLEEKVEELNKSNHDLEQFAYIASHDLQEPLRKIRNFSDMLKRNIGEEEKVLRFINSIDLSSSRMLTLIRDVLKYSRLSKDGNNFENVHLEDILKSVKVDMELLIEEKKAVISAKGLCSINVIPQQIYQLFYNLISNALKFNTGNPRVNIVCSEMSSSEIKQIPELHNTARYVKLQISDNGIGFEQKYASQVFAIFKRLNSREDYAGTGIGLALCKKIIDNHHGRISVKSEIGKGTEFQVILPVD